MNAYKVHFHADGMNGSYNFAVVADTLDDAKEKWATFVKTTRAKYFWEKAEKGMQNHYGGYIVWTDLGVTDKAPGCYEMEYDRWNVGSDHLWD